MTQEEIACWIAKEQNKGRGIAVIVPESKELPSANRIREEVQKCSQELLTELDGCYAINMSNITDNKSINEFIMKAFDIGKIDSADIFFC